MTEDDNIEVDADDMPSTYEPGAVVYVRTLGRDAIALITSMSMASSLYPFRYEAQKWNPALDAWELPESWNFVMSANQPYWIGALLSEHQILGHAPFTGVRVGFGFNFEGSVP